MANRGGTIMPKGHSDLPERIAALELTNKATHSLIDDMLIAQKAQDDGYVALANLLKAAEERAALIDEMLHRLSQLEIRFKDWREAFNRGNIPQAGLPLTEYKPQFTVWPGANPSSNGS
jgi:hypothetical protein